MRIRPSVACTRTTTRVSAIRTAHDESLAGPPAVRRPAAPTRYRLPGSVSLPGTEVTERSEAMATQQGPASNGPRRTSLAQDRSKQTRRRLVRPPWDYGPNGVSTTESKTRPSRRSPKPRASRRAPSIFTLPTKKTSCKNSGGAQPRRFTRKPCGGWPPAARDSHSSAPSSSRSPGGWRPFPRRGGAGGRRLLLHAVPRPVPAAPRHAPRPRRRHRGRPDSG